MKRDIAEKLGRLCTKWVVAEAATLCSGLGSVLIFTGALFGIGLIVHTLNSTSLERLLLFGFAWVASGYLLVWLGLRCLGEYYNDEDLKRASLFDFIFLGSVSWSFNITSIYLAIVVALFMYTVSDLEIQITTLSEFFAAISELLAAMAVMPLMAGFFNIFLVSDLRKIYAALAARSGEKLFDDVIQFYLWGSALLIAYSLLFFYLFVSSLIIASSPLSNELAELRDIWTKGLGFIWTSLTITALPGAGLISAFWMISAAAFFYMKLQQPGIAARGIAARTASPA